MKTMIVIAMAMAVVTSGVFAAEKCIVNGGTLITKNGGCPPGVKVTKLDDFEKKSDGGEAFRRELENYEYRKAVEQQRYRQLQKEAYDAQLREEAYENQQRSIAIQEENLRLQKEANRIQRGIEAQMIYRNGMGR